ncbi:hypothetical protein ABIE65_003352, partial [Constrictibacter sp. MBR-5]
PGGGGGAPPPTPTRPPGRPPPPPPPGPDPEDDLEAELAYLRSIAPPVALNPTAPSWARHPDPLVRGGQSDLHGWDPAWERPG